MGAPCPPNLSRGVAQRDPLRMQNTQLLFLYGTIFYYIIYIERVFGAYPSFTKRFVLPFEIIY
tara:strand:- start:73 stop:261 length:189 start_codon:yes stop_codon:yes gene_type:complete